MKSFISILFILPFIISAQAPDTAWTKTFGVENYYDGGYSVQQTYDGGYIIAGYTTRINGTAHYDVYLIKTDSLGDSLWAKTFGRSEDDEGYSVQQTTDGGYIIIGKTGLSTIGSGVYLIRTDSNGDSLWTRTYENGIGLSGQKTIDGGYIITGTSESDVYLIKTDSNGDSLWAKIFGGDNYEEGNSVQQTTDGGYVIAGIAPSQGKNYVYLIKTNSNGDSLWTRTYGYGWGNSVQQTVDGGYIITGTTGAEGYDVYLIKTDSNGDSLWAKTFGADIDYIEEGYSVKQTSDKGYIIAGCGGPLPDVYLIKTDSLGDIIWEKFINKSGVSWGYSVQQTKDGGYIVAGKIIAQAPANVYLLKINPESGINEKKIHSTSYLFKCNPNPFTKEVRINYYLPKECDVNIKVFNILGQKIRDIENCYKTKGEHLIIWDGKDNKCNKLPSGIYFLNIVAGDDKATRKLVLIR